MTDDRDGCPDCGDIDHHGCDPRWTVIYPPGESTRLAYGARDAETRDPWCDDLIVRCAEPVSRQAYLGPQGFDALVAAVHDADLLRQARLLAQAARLSDPEDTIEYWTELVDLLDLLAPVSGTPSPGTDRCIKWDGDPEIGMDAVCGLPRPCPKHEDEPAPIPGDTQTEDQT